jgi:hypothetical protein
MNEIVVIYHILNGVKQYFNGGCVSKQGDLWSSDRSEAICFSLSQYEHLLNDPVFTHHYEIKHEPL